MICRQCRCEIPDDSSRCPHCGVVLEALDEMQTVVGESSAPSGADAADHPTIAGSQVGSPASPTFRISPALETTAVDFGPRYRVEALLGKGGMGAVYRARDVELDRTVALKVIRPELVSLPESMQRFKQELLLASKISHKNILRIHDLVEYGGTRFISMAYIDGEDLYSLLKREGRLPLEQVLSIASQLCSALDAAHSEGIIHRDLKPQNVMIDRDGMAYISDFGLAKSLEAGAAHMTQTGEVLGTPRYMSPEQVEGKQAGCRSDLYSLGLIIYEMATAAIPFAAESVFQTMYRRTRERPKDPRLLNPEVPEFLSRIILRCLETDPQERYASAREILRDIEAARAPTRRFRIRAPGPGARRLILGAALALLLVAALLSIPAVRSRIFPGPPAAQEGAAGSVSPAAKSYVAVLPFRILGDASTLGYISRGIGEALSARLFQLKSVYVPAFREAEKYSPDDPLEKVARELGVKLIVKGTIAQSGDRISVVLNLQDVAGGKQLWAKEFSGLIQDLLTLEDQIYGDLLVGLRLTPDSEERARTATHSTENIEAYDLYLKGRNALRGRQDAANLKAAIDFYEQALKKDAGFALAYVGLADTSLALYRATKENSWAQRAVAAGEQAQRLNDQLPEVYLSLGSIYTATGKSAEAIAVLNRALTLASNSDEAFRRLGAAYSSAGRTEDSIRAYERAVDINPYYWLNFSTLGGAYFKLGRFDDALKAYQKVVELEPENNWGHLNVGAVLFSQGKYEECIPAFQKALEIKPSWEIYSNLGTAYFYLKRYPEAVGAFERAAELSPNQEIVHGNLADAYRWSGQPAQADASYDRAIALAYKELEVNPRNADAMSSLALYYAKKGTTTRALDFVRRARSLDAKNVEFMYTEAVVRTLAGKKQEAIQSLRQALENGYAFKDAVTNPELEPLQALPEWKQLVSDFGKDSPSGK